nr:DUF3274 domain-containing protein [Dyella sp. ASV21]
MADPAHVGCIGGLRWTGAQCATTFEQAEHVFDERDNRGNVLLYFTPQDQTVGLRNVQGIGWQGVPSALVGELGNRFYQRIFTLRERNAQPEEVGTPPHAYVMREAGESTWDGNGQGWFGNATRSELDKGQVAVVNAPPLPRAFRPNFHGEGNVVSTTGGKDGIHMVKSRMDPIDASIAITNGGWKPGVYMSYDLDKNDPVFAQGYHKDAVQAAINAGRAPFDQTQIKHVVLWDEGTVRVVRTESPSDARQRLMEIPDEQLTKADALSFHSAIPANPDHSRYAVAYDLAIGQAKSLDDEAFYTYLCRVADWRLGWGEKKNYSSFRSQNDAERQDPDDSPDAETLALYQAEAAAHRQLIDATADYHANGKPQAYPAYFQPPLPSLVRSETRV